ncbi:hypothetical protein M9H77_26787 [Catharanthus roseus]|uniref:Uncharacterized protein n=1 Tax=Catharanthus roseus TaxID=4058 RepID=A0ACC0ABI8_CATRO|nr:hypothetical protein M9H77_26787 [Catharanthus roseus]
MESQEGLGTKIGPKADLTLSVEPDCYITCSLNSGVEGALICLDSLRLRSCARTPYVGSSISGVKETKEKCFLITLHELFCETASPLVTQDGQRYNKPLKLGVKFLVRVSPKGHVFLFCSLMLELFVKYFHPCIGGIRALGATHSFGSFLFIKHIPIPSVVVSYQLIASTPIGMSKMTEDLSTRSASSPPYEASSDGVDGFKLGRVDPLEEERSTIEGLAKSVYVDIASCSAVGQLPCGEPGGA